MKPIPFTDEMIQAYVKTMASYDRAIASLVTGTDTEETVRISWFAYGFGCRLCQAAPDVNGGVDCSACILKDDYSLKHGQEPCTESDSANKPYKDLMAATTRGNTSPLLEALKARRKWLYDRALENDVELEACDA